MAARCNRRGAGARPTLSTTRTQLSTAARRCGGRSWARCERGGTGPTCSSFARPCASTTPRRRRSSCGCMPTLPTRRGSTPVRPASPRLLEPARLRLTGPPQATSACSAAASRGPCLWTCSRSCGMASASGRSAARSHGRHALGWTTCRRARRSSCAGSGQIRAQPAAPLPACEGRVGWPRGETGRVGWRGAQGRAIAPLSSHVAFVPHTPQTAPTRREGPLCAREWHWLERVQQARLQAVGSLDWRRVVVGARSERLDGGLDGQR